MGADYYQHTEAQKKFLALIPEYQGDFDALWEAGREAISKMDRMLGKNDSSFPHTQGTDITKLMFRAILWLKRAIGDKNTDWTNFDLSPYAVELAKSQPLFGFGLKGKGAYEAKIEAEYRKAKEMGLGVDAASIDAALEHAAEFVPPYRFLLKLMDDGYDLNLEKVEMAGLRSYKRLVAEIMLEDAEHQLLKWFEGIFIRDPMDSSLVDDRAALSSENAQLRTLFFELKTDYDDRIQGEKLIKSMLS